MNLADGVLARCRATPAACALAEGERELRYGDLARRIEAIAAGLRRRGISPGQRVAICLDRGIDAAVSILGVLRAGAVYVPLDLKNPRDRLAYIVGDAGCAALIGQGARPDWFEDGLWLDIANLDSALAVAECPEKADGEQLAAIMYTSGSTGRPKGVALSHRAMAAFADWAGERFRVTSSDRIASLAPFFFDLSVFDLFSGLSRGARLEFVPTGLTLAPARLSQWLAGRKISLLYTVPSLLGFLALKGNLGATLLPGLRQILFAGEIFPTPLLMRLAELLPATELCNLYGPTETNVCCHWPVERARLSSEAPIPIGVPAAGAELRIEAATGELWVRGPTLLSGYWAGGRLQPALDANGWYPTGDRVSQVPSGEYHYHGRLDRMFKCSGYRIEPAEIEAAVSAVQGVAECAVVGIADSAGNRRPAVAVAGVDSDFGRVVGSVRARLPAYMHPYRYAQVERLPRLANGKVDYGAVAKLLENDHEPA